jgi:hypothetical protein
VRKDNFKIEKQLIYELLFCFFFSQRRGSHLFSGE